MDAQDVEARESIRDLVARYNANGDAGRFDAMLELFAENAVLEVPGQELRGRQEIRDFFESVARDPKRRPVRLLRHFIATHQVDIDGEDAARGRCYYQVLTENGLDHWGRYVDVYVKHDGCWLFAARKASVDGMAPKSWAKTQT